MNILFLERNEVDLYETLFASETSRNALRFYRPQAVTGGVMVTTASLGSALSLVSELRWYIRRYMQEVLFELGTGIYCTHRLAREAYYDRSASLAAPWEFRRLYAIHDGILAREPLQPGMTAADCRDRYQAGDLLFEVWCTADECTGKIDIPDEREDEPGSPPE